MSEKHDKLAFRIAQILTKLNNAETFTLNELSAEFGVNVRTVQRDINERLSFLPIEKKGNYYSLESYALGKLNFKDIENFAKLCGVKSLFPSLSNEFIKEILDTKSNNTYIVDNQDFEDISPKEEYFKNLNKSINECFSIKFKYSNKDRIVSPYKLINNQGIWYLIADDNNNLKTFAFSNIKSLEILYNNKFTPKKEFLNDIEKNKNIWISNENIEVLLEVNNDAKKYFLRKNRLKNMKIIEKNDKSFVVSTTVYFDDEILKVVKYWIPYIKILKPEYLKDKFKSIIKSYLEEYND